ncbi:hypothetical protein SAMN05428949_1265 [Chitinophaga sp. YR627]|uniref:hypothetical protein n=1 Tax=Chitinophaga sp. YR627 TaxID=1881041 RepID=UPI0008E2FBFB|nr:hypothetical protein [Chitinophaga sp. YR627]SFM91106.1 hypothetical protein SAMN05428949_1265 [Chitinophaga sp. YR627]
MEQQPATEKKTLLQTLRESVLPVKPNDHVVVKFGKNIGFGVFLVLFSCVSLAIVLSISLAL